MAKDNDGWKEAGIGNTWNYKEQGKGAIFQGVYIGKEENVGENNSMLYSFETTDGEIVQVWGTTLLDTRFKNLHVGEEVKIEYLGETPSPKRKGKMYHNFAVYHREIPYAKVEEEIDPNDIPDDIQ